jgi:tetratricopeptide (TPR) repeat protein
MNTWNDDIPMDDEFDFSFDIGEIHEAHEFFASDDEDTSQSFMKMGQLYASAGRYDEALAEYDEAIMLNPSEMGYYFHRGVALFHLGRHQEAMDDFSLSLAADPWNKVEILDFTGAIKFKSGDVKGARKDVGEVVKKKNGHTSNLKLSPEEIESLLSNKKLNG